MFSFARPSIHPTHFLICPALMLKDGSGIVVANPVTKAIVRFTQESFKSFLHADGLRIDDYSSMSGESRRFISGLKDLGVIEATSRRETAYDMSKIEAQLSRLGNTRTLVLNPPFRPTLNINERCRCDCIHCYNNKNSFAEMDESTIANRVIKPLADMGCTNIMWSGGDPVISPEKTIRLTLFASRQGMTVTTQATEFSKEFLAGFAAAGGKGIQISLFASPDHPEIDDKIRGRAGIWDISVKNIISAQEQGLAVFINMILFPENMDEFEETARYVHDLRVDTFRCSVAVAQGQGKLNMARLTFQKDQTKELVDRALRLKAKYKHEMNILVDVSERSPKQSSYSICNAGSVYLHVAGFNVYPCNFMMENCFCAGSIRDRPIDDVWRLSPVWHKFRALTPIHEDCQDCESRKSNYPTCTDCRAVMYIKYGSFLGSDEVPCKYAKNP